MSEEWCEVTREKFEARCKFFTDLFSKWRGKLCENMAVQNPRFVNNAEQIIWRTDEDGTVYNPAKLCHLYFGDYLPKAKYLMQDRSHFMDRHKIVALTQRLLLEHCPIVYAKEKPFSHLKKENMSGWVRSLNVSFAYYFAIEYLGAWKKEESEKILKQSFNANNLFLCLNSTNFAREHRKFLMLEFLPLDPVYLPPDSPADSFPTVLMAHLWFALEQWGLECMQHP